MLPPLSDIPDTVLKYGDTSVLRSIDPFHTRSFSLAISASLARFFRQHPCNHFKETVPIHLRNSRRAVIITPIMPVSQRRFAVESAITLPILWGLVALLLAFCIPPPPLAHQLRPIYHHSPRTDLTFGLDDTTPGEGRTALILTAHPDDEAMFFSPTIRGLRNHGWDVRGLCLSTGNSEGQGEARRGELFSSYGVLGVDEGNVQVLDIPYAKSSSHDLTSFCQTLLTSP